MLLSTGKGACIVKGHNAEDSEIGLIRIIDLLEKVLQHWDSYEDKRHTEFVAMFNKFDAVRRHSFELLNLVADANRVVYVSCPVCGCRITTSNYPWTNGKS